MSPSLPAGLPPGTCTFGLHISVYLQIAVLLLSSRLPLAPLLNTGNGFAKRHVREVGAMISFFDRFWFSPFCSTSLLGKHERSPGCRSPRARSLPCSGLRPSLCCRSTPRVSPMFFRMCGTVTFDCGSPMQLMTASSGVFTPYLLLPFSLNSSVTSFSHCAIAASSSLMPMFSVIALTSVGSSVTFRFERCRAPLRAGRLACPEVAVVQRQAVADCGTRTGASRRRPWISPGGNASVRLRLLLSAEFASFSPISPFEVSPGQATLTSRRRLCRLGRLARASLVKSVGRSLLRRRTAPRLGSVTLNFSARVAEADRVAQGHVRASFRRWRAAGATDATPAPAPRRERHAHTRSADRACGTGPAEPFVACISHPPIVLAGHARRHSPLMISSLYVDPSDCQRKHSARSLRRIDPSVKRVSSVRAEPASPRGLAAVHPERPAGRTVASALSTMLSATHREQVVRC